MTLSEIRQRLESLPPQLDLRGQDMTDALNIATAEYIQEQEMLWSEEPSDLQIIAFHDGFVRGWTKNPR